MLNSTELSGFGVVVPEVIVPSPVYAGNLELPFSLDPSPVDTLTVNFGGVDRRRLLVVTGLGAASAATLPATITVDDVPPSSFTVIDLPGVSFNISGFYLALFPVPDASSVEVKITGAVGGAVCAVYHLLADNAFCRNSGTIQADFGPNQLDKTTALGRYETLFGVVTSSPNPFTVNPSLDLTAVIGLIFPVYLGFYHFQNGVTPLNHLDSVDAAGDNWHSIHTGVLVQGVY